MFAQKYPASMLGGMTDGANGLAVGSDGDLGGYSDQLTMGDLTLDWNSIIRQAIATGDHAISAFSGRNSGVQVGVNPQGGIFAIQQTSPVYDEAQLYANRYANLTPQQRAALGQQGVAEDAFGSITNFVSEHPLAIGAVAFGLFLLFREPPRRR